MDIRTTTTTIINPTNSIRRADIGDLARVSCSLADAFAHDPVFEWCIPNPSRRAEILPRLFRLFAEAVLPLGESEIAVDGSGSALWVPVGQAPVAEDQAEDFEAAVFDLIGEDVGRVGAIMALLDEHHPSDPHRFLWFVGVESGAQGNGLGSALLASMLQRCDCDGTAAYLDATSKHNRRLYERHGFVVTAERSVDGSPPLWAMWRAAR